MLYRYLIVGFLVLVFSSGCFAAETETKSPVQNVSSVQELVNFVNEASFYSQKVGKEPALQMYADPNGSFTRGNVYIWAYDFSGINLAHPFHPEYKGKNKLSLTDPDGKPMIAMMRDTALNGSGFVTYQYENPITGKTEPKLAYVKRVDENWWLGSGIYGDIYSIPNSSPELMRESLTGTVNNALKYVDEVGKEQALKVFNNQTGPFTVNGSYIFGFTMNGTTLSHPFHPDKLGSNESTFTDINGVSIGGEKLSLAKEGGGFWYYVFNNPDAENKPEFKVSYIKPVDEDWVIGNGRYIGDVQVNFSPDVREQLTTKIEEAMSYVNEHGKTAAIKEFNDPNGSFSDPEMFIYAVDLKGTVLANSFLPGRVGQNYFNVQEPYGKYPVRQMITNAKNGGGFTYYFYADPKSGYENRLKLGYSELAGDDMVVSAGVFAQP